MRRSVAGYALSMGLVMGMAGLARAQGGGNGSSPPPPPPHGVSVHAAAGVLYEDPDGASSATVTQVLPNSNTSLMTFGKVRRIRVQQQIVVIEWGGGAVTMLPQQYVGSITVNKRSGTGAGG